MRASRFLSFFLPLFLGCGGSEPQSPATSGPTAPVTTPIPGPTSDANPAGPASPIDVPLPKPPSGKHVGATPVEGGGAVEFRVWAPNATSAFVVGAEVGRHELAKEAGGYFGARVDGAKAGQHYRFELTGADGQKLERIDPRARMTDGGGNAVVIDPRTYVWKSSAKSFTPPDRDHAVVYEMHIGSFHAPKGPTTGSFVDATAKLDALANLGVNVIELMPVNAHGSHGWGYNPQLYFAPHASFGTPDEMRAFVDAAHERGIAVILDIVFNHYDGWSQAPLRCFDSAACANGNYGVYFFDADPYKKTPWGPRPDFSKEAVSDFFADNLFAWMTEYRIDGFRHDSVSNVRAIDGQGSVPGGVSLLRRLNDVSKGVSAKSLLIAEDLKGNALITQPTAANAQGMGFDTQWDGGFHWAITTAVSGANDDARDLNAVKNALTGNYNGDPFQRLLYVESHDTAGNDTGNRLPVRIDGANPTSITARRRTMLATALLLTAPGVPMLFMGQEMLNTVKFAAQPAPLDWSGANQGVQQFHRDMIRLRRNIEGKSAGLTGKNIQVTHQNDSPGNKVLVYRRDDVMVIANFGAKKYARYDIGLPTGGTWIARLDSDTVRYGADLGSQQPTTVTVTNESRDGLPFMGSIALGPYSVVVITR